ncbi:MAG: glycine--tRNA ligase subunit beta [Alphaproteobacteria bacterium]|nr:glycine--tRNA ligase subunit beta [Alphaproteobacteria bacterium]
MTELLLELFSEEIPARMQAGAARDLERLMVEALSDRGLLFEGIKAFSGPRRLTLAIAGLPAKQKDVREELKGPKVDAPAAAIDGFLKKTRLTREQLKVESTPKGDVYMALIEREGRDAAAVLAEIIPEVMGKLPWPKSMRWKPGVSTRWVRPLHSILATFDGEVVPFSFAGVSSGNHTRGHRFLSEGRIEARRFEDYEAALKKAHVILDTEERAAIIFEGVKSAAFVHGLELIPDEGLLAEVSGLAEWPVVYVGSIEDQFMEVPPEILQTSMRTHQKYFALRDPKTGRMANKFGLVANMIAADGGKEIVAGNERVLRARLSDAKFFWDEDRKRTLESRVHDLKGIVYYEEYTYWHKVDSIATKASIIAAEIGADPSKAKRASRLSKADLTSGLVGEFPELQGLMGRYFALNDKEEKEVADAIRDHYKPQGPSDGIPESDVGASVALADKLSTLYWLFHEGERPTGSKDPYALRRAALGVVRIILEKKYRFGLKWFLDLGWYGALTASTEGDKEKTESDLLEFIVDRLKVALKGKGIRHDLIDAVFSLGNEDDLVRLVTRVEALQAFLKTDDGKNLLAGYKRAANILKVEEKKDGRTYISEVDEKLLPESADKALHAALAKAVGAIGSALDREDFAGAMREMAALRGPVDSFFEAVKVNADDPKLRENRLHLLAGLRAALQRVADFSKIEG